MWIFRIEVILFEKVSILGKGCMGTLLSNEFLNCNGF